MAIRNQKALDDAVSAVMAVRPLPRVDTTSPPHVDVPVSPPAANSINTPSESAAANEIRRSIDELKVAVVQYFDEVDAAKSKWREDGSIPSTELMHFPEVLRERVERLIAQLRADPDFASLIGTAAATGSIPSVIKLEEGFEFILAQRRQADQRADLVRQANAVVADLNRVRAVDTEGETVLTSLRRLLEETSSALAGPDGEKIARGLCARMHPLARLRGPRRGRQTGGRAVRGGDLARGLAVLGAEGFGERND